MPATARRSPLLGVLLACACPGPASTDTDATTAAAATACDTECGETSTTGGDAPTTSAGDDPTTGEAETTTTGDALPGCEPLPGLPPPFAVDGVAHVLLDLHRIEAELIFNPATQEIRGAAVFDFTTGDVEGLPLFDLRQAITRAVLDGEELAPDTLAHVELPGGETTMIAIPRLLAPCGEHTLELEYAVEALDTSRSFVFAPDIIAWGTHLFDYPSHRLAEKWLPSNLIHDVHDLTLDVILEDGMIAHKLVANAPVAELGPNHWQIDYVDATSMSPMVQLCPAGSALNLVAEVEVGDVTVAVEAWNCTTWLDSPPELEAAMPKLASALQYSHGELGPYPHGDRFLAVITPMTMPYPMEYPGATVTETWAAPHEIFHSWIGRGVRPLTQRDAWFDETWTEYAVNDAYMSEPIDPAAPPIELAGPNLWARTFSTDAYTTGPQVFASIAAEVGQDDFRAVLRDFYAAYTGQAISTETLERELHCRIGGDLVRQRFHRFIYGRDGAAPQPPADYCEHVKL